MTSDSSEHTSVQCTQGGSESEHHFEIFWEKCRHAGNQARVHAIREAQQQERRIVKKNSDIFVHLP